MVNGDELAATLALPGFSLWKPGMPTVDEGRILLSRSNHGKGQAQLMWRLSSRGNARGWYFCSVDLRAWHEIPWDAGLISYISPRMARQFINAYTR